MMREDGGSKGDGTGSNEDDKSSERLGNNKWLVAHAHVPVRGVENGSPRTPHIYATKSPRNLHSALEPLP